MIEFLLVIMVIFTLLFGFLQLAWALAWGHYVHYATFMAARAYLAAHETREQQLANATEVLTAMVKAKSGSGDLFGQIAPARVGDDRDVGSGDEPVPGSFIGTHPYAVGQDMRTRSFSWAEGVQYNFKFKLFLIPFAKWIMGDEGKRIPIGPRGEEKTIAWDGQIGLSSDAFLGREPTNVECREYMSGLARGMPRGDGAEYLFDNGC